MQIRSLVLSSALTSAGCGQILGAGFGDLQLARDAATEIASTDGAPLDAGLLDGRAPDGPDGNRDSGTFDATLPDGSRDGGDPGGDGAGPPALPISPTARNSLLMWFSADRGLACTDAGTATGWADISGHDAGAVTSMDAAGIYQGAHLGPACGDDVASLGHVINGIPVPYFNAPDSGNTAAPYVDGTFNIDLAALAGTPFTVLVVERRWPLLHAAKANGWILGSLGPPDAALFPPAASALQLGYIAYNGCTQIAADLSQDGVANRVSDPPQTGPAPVSLDMLRNANPDPMTVAVNGVPLTSPPPPPELLSLGAKPLLGAGGFLGAAVNVNVGSESRFVGDIAEVLVFSSALSDTDVLAVQQYLQSHWGDGGVFPSVGSGGGCPAH